jgi:O-antigen/teichoic acid export membrane protein
MDRVQTAFPPGTLRARFAGGAFWSLAGAVIAQGLQLAASIGVARWLGKVGFGELGILSSTVGMFGAFAGLGLGLTATKYVAEFRARDPERAGKILGLCMTVATISGLVSSGVLLGLAPTLAARVLNAPSLVPELRITCGLLFLNILIGVQNGALGGLEAFADIAKVNLARGLLNFPFMVAGAIYFGLRGAVWGMVVGAAGGCLVGHLVVERECARGGIRIGYLGAWREKTILWSFSAPAFLASIIGFPAMWGANAVLVNRPNGYAEMGIFNAANQWRVGVMFLPTIANQVLLPILSNLYGDNDSPRFRKVLLANLLVVGGITLGLSLPIVFLSRFIMGAYGPGFTQGHMVLVALVLSAFFASAPSVIASAIASISKMWVGFVMNAIWGVTFVMAAFFWINRGAMGVAMAYLASYILHAVIVAIYALKFMAPVISGGRRTYAATVAD